MISPTVCQVAIGLSITSMAMQAIAAVARRRAAAPAAVEPVEPAAVEPTPPVELPTAASLKLSRMELLQHARALGVGNARFRNSARKTELVRAIQQHNQQRRTA